MSAGGHVAIQDIERLSGVSRLEQWAGVGGISLRLRTILDSGLVAAGAWAVVAPYTAQCEVRAISSYQDRDIVVAALTYAHDPDTAVLVITEPVLNPKWFGAQVAAADNSTALTAALNAAAWISGALDFDELYPVTSGVSVPASNMRLASRSGRGGISAASGTFNVLTVDTKTDVEISDLRIIQGGSYTGTDDGNGIYLKDSDRCKILRNHLSNYTSAGIRLTGSDDNLIEGNILRAAAEVSFQPFPADAAQVLPIAVDISIRPTGSRNIIVNNFCYGGGTHGIAVLTYNNDDTADRNLIEGNHISDHNGYGILLYRNEQGSPPFSQSLKGSIVQSNHIWGITGERRAGNDANQLHDQVFGAGIYVQGAEDTQIVNNDIEDTNSETNYELLAPGAIGVANAGNVSIIGNRIRTANWYGIHINDAGERGQTTGGFHIQGNTIVGVTLAGIKTIEANRVKIVNNIIDTCAEQGIITQVNDSTIRKNYTIEGNTIRNTTLSGIQLSYVNDAKVSNNHVSSAAVHGITAANSSDLQINNNFLVDITSRGINIASTCSGLLSAKGNSFISCSVGIYSDAPYMRGEENQFSAVTTLWQGTYIPWRDLASADADATPSVLYDDMVDLVASTAAYTNFDDGSIGQRLLLRATGALTVNHSANVILQGGSNFSMVSNNMLELVKLTSTVWREISRTT